MDDQSGFLRWNLFLWRFCEECWNVNKGFQGCPNFWRLCATLEEGFVLGHILNMLWCIIIKKKSSKVNLQFCVGLHSQPSWAACGPQATGWTPLLNCINLVDKVAQGLRGLTPVLKYVLLWVECCQTALHTTEKSFVEESINVTNFIFSC